MTAPDFEYEYEYEYEYEKEKEKEDEHCVIRRCEPPRSYQDWIIGRFGDMICLDTIRSRHEFACRWRSTG